MNLMHLSHPLHTHQRQVHLDFHTSPHIPGVAAALNTSGGDPIASEANTTETLSPTPDPAKVWSQAQQRSNEQYRAMFGNAAYNQKTFQAALEAL